MGGSATLTPTINWSILPMRTFNRLMHGYMVLILCLGLTVLGCTDRRGGYKGPTVDAFHGKVVHDGNPVKFAENEAQLSLFHEKGEQFGIPLKADGTFEIGWMPIGKYAVMLERVSQTTKGPTKIMHNVRDVMTIKEGKKYDVIELVKDFKP